jgi:hypothetical protein
MTAIARTNANGASADANDLAPGKTQCRAAPSGVRRIGLPSRGTIEPALLSCEKA